MAFRHPILFFLILTCFLLPNKPVFADRVLTDLLGRRVTLSENPHRVVSLAPNITEMVYALGEEARLKGVSLFSDYPIQAKQHTKVGSYIALDLEKIVAIKPDLCIAIKDGNPKRVIDRLASLGIAVYAVDPRDLNSVMETILHLGNLLNAAEKAETLVQEMRARIRGVKKNVSSVSHQPGVFFQIGISPIVSVGTDTFIHELIVLAGGINLAAGSTTYPRFNREQILVLAPDIFIITSMARSAVFEEVKAKWNKWPQIPAVQNQQIYIEDSNLFDRPSPRLVDGLELLVKLIHPELFKGMP
jgi:iron complex transport system substrate-binding protein